MRVSVDEQDPGYEPLRNIWVLDIEFDGRLIPRNQTITADEDVGKALVYVLNRKGYPLVKSDGQTLRKVVQGRVVIHWRNNAEDRRPQHMVGPGVVWDRGWELAARQG